MSKTNDHQLTVGNELKCFKRLETKPSTQGDGNGEYRSVPAEEVISIGDETEVKPGFVFHKKKSVAQGMLDLALLSANANQLRTVLDMEVHDHFYFTSLSLISSSLVLQVLVAIALMLKSKYRTKEPKEFIAADRIRSFIIIGILLITIMNVVLAAFMPAPKAG